MKTYTFQISGSSSKRYFYNSSVSSSYKFISQSGRMSWLYIRLLW